MADADWLTVDEVALRLRVHVVTVHRYVREGVLAASKIGKRYWIPASALDDLLRKNLREGRPPTTKREALAKATGKKTTAVKRTPIAQKVSSSKYARKPPSEKG